MQVELKENKNYILHSDGRVYSKRAKKFLKPQMIRRSKSHRYVWGKGGYPAYRINGKMFKIHRLQAEYFIPNPNPKEFDCVLHLDDDPMNWALDNLQWGNHKINMQMFADNKRKANV